MPRADSPQHPPGYEVLVCTYNGADYIADQLDSILAQNPAPQRVLVSDDGSTDETTSIVQKVAAKASIPIELIPGPRKGVAVNVLSGLKQTRADYVFLADQDDIWLDNKAALFTQQMKHQQSPHLIFSDAWVWNPETDQKDSFWKLDGLKPENAQTPKKLVFFNTVQGASSCVNRALIDTVEINDAMMMHDWWLALHAATQGVVTQIATPTMLYRQHKGNQIGTYNARKQQKRLLRYRLKIARAILNQARAFSEHYASAINPSCRTFLKELNQALNGHLLTRLTFIIKQMPTHRNLRNTLVLWATLLLLSAHSAK